jgi:hypothetical protein
MILRKTILQHALSTELNSIISSHSAEREELSEIEKEFSSIIEQELYIDSDYYTNKMQELHDLFMEKRAQYLIKFEIIKLIIKNPIFLN